MNKCGQCRQFTRTRENQKDLCGAWEQPTMADRQACDFFAPKASSGNSAAFSQQSME
ncbi:hypothetical protein [Agarivorans sp. B2Z047]|uniref:hypothetical protein n=1 Tax=Agarivorans sp. B2Z047 TaxID=2652721 RepID=UPI001884608C|nr:hypothetical protein [Agarivorans sp. B2Z047]UQN41636.1 hypothetical protein LQZ07_17960 [Agarivorans sp. B2Z047]